MDHHCPFVNNCIGQNNHKLFWNFLLFASVSGLQVAASLLIWSKQDGETFGDQMRRMEKETSVFIAATLAMALGLSTLIMWVIHTWMIVTSKTTIESGVLLEHNPFNKGLKRNWQSVFGINNEGLFGYIKWFLPVPARLEISDFIRGEL